MCDILQRKVAEYGDDSGELIILIKRPNTMTNLSLGTKTQGSKSAAKSKFDKYLDGLGRDLSQ
jgi:hypothetical protein